MRLSQTEEKKAADADTGTASDMTPALHRKPRIHSGLIQRSLHLTIKIPLWVEVRYHSLAPATPNRTEELFKAAKKHLLIKHERLAGIK